MKPLIVGEVNPYGANPDHALFPWPRRASGDRLRVHLGLTDSEYLRGFDRVNLCVGKWDLKKARSRATELAKEWLFAEDSRHIVLLGKKVCQAFLLDFRPFWMDSCFIVLPHPSGLSRLWNEPGAPACARAILTSIGALPVPPLGTSELPGTEWTTGRPARCSNCGIRVESEDCPDCGPVVPV